MYMKRVEPDSKEWKTASKDTYFSYVTGLDGKIVAYKHSDHRLRDSELYDRKNVLTNGHAVSFRTRNTVVRCVTGLKIHSVEQNMELNMFTFTCTKHRTRKAHKAKYHQHYTAALRNLLEKVEKALYKGYKWWYIDADDKKVSGYQEPVVTREFLKNNGFRYLWVAELQKNGAIHFHVAMPYFIHTGLLNELWRFELKKLGHCILLENHKLPWPVHISRAKDGGTIKDVGLYMAKYLSKTDSNIKHVKCLGCRAYGSDRRTSRYKKKTKLYFMEALRTVEQPEWQAQYFVVNEEIPIIVYRNKDWSKRLQFIKYIYSLNTF